MNAPPAEQRLILTCVRRAVLPDGAPSLEADERSAALWRRTVPLAGRASLSSITFTGAGEWLREAPPEAAAALRARSRATRIAETPARVLAPVDALLLTCVHLAYAHRYRWFALRGLADVLVLAAGRAGELDWRRFVVATGDAGADGAAYWPL